MRHNGRKTNGAIECSARPNVAHRHPKAATIGFAGALALLGASDPAWAQTGANVLLVVNDASPTGETIAKRWLRVNSDEETFSLMW